MPEGSHHRSKYCSERCVRIARHHNPYAKTRNSGRSTAQAITRAAIHEQGGACILCGWSLPDQTGVQVHHIIPVADDGLNNPENLAVLCPNCHMMADKGYIQQGKLQEAREAAISRNPGFASYWERLRPAIERLDEQRRAIREGMFAKRHSAR